jgi:phage anti-repressor protein
MQLDQISLEKGRAIAYIAGTFIRLHESGELEERIKNMENGMVLDLEKRLAILEKNKGTHA